MVIGVGQQETLDNGFVLLGTRQQGVPVILRGLVLLGGFDPSQMWGWGGRLECFDFFSVYRIILQMENDDITF
ncbi:unnamed protein product [Schistosoma mattheei]|uniref:Uncharacterized protein n=1 Tax=Schistosoma mattheei TaxID=31246 RepID=A0A183PWJ7_9TREM|nr:unnamed protein product [Schistosoma mattheei]